MVKYLSHVWRLLVINFILARYGLGRFLLTSNLFASFSPLRLLIYSNVGYWISSKQYSRGEALRRSLEDLGPIFVKFGQALSTRGDMLPDDIVAELALLQDKVNPFPSETAIKIIEQEYGKPLHEIFQEFKTTPLASASVAQVHEATLLDGKKIIVKVLRPHIKKTIKRDINLLYAIASLIERCWEDGRRLKIKEVVAEFERTILDELDLLREAASASQLRRNFAHSAILYIPEVYWPYARKKVLVQEKVSGIPISDIDALKQHGINLKRLAEYGVQIFFTQVFRDSFFHADMHPGNIFVSPNHTESPKYIAVDFGIMGSLNRKDQHYLAENFLAFFNRDYRRVAELHIESGWVPFETRVDQFEAAIRTVCEPIFERPLRDISYGQVLLRLFQTGRRFKMEVQPQLVLLQKTLIAIEGLGRQLYPELDLWNTAKPFLEKWLKDRVGVRSIWKRVRENAPLWAIKFPEMPGLLHDTLAHIREQQLQNGFYAAHNRKIVVKNSSIKRWCIAITLAALFGLGFLVGKFYKF